MRRARGWRACRRPAGSRRCGSWRIGRVAAICVWFQAVGRQALKLLWQSSHDWLALVGMCVADLPVARPAPWQVVQVPATTPVWSKFAAGHHAVVRWQLSHDAVVWMWLGGLPALSVPLWQVWHEPGATPAWLNLAPMKVLVRVAGLAGLLRRDVLLRHHDVAAREAHARQVARRAVARRALEARRSGGRTRSASRTCLPVSAKPVFR